MQELDLSLAVLSDIEDNDTSFSEALRKIFQADVSIRPLRGTVAGLVGCELRHHLLFVFLTENLEKYEVADKRFLALALADAYFFKRIPLETLVAECKTKLGDEKYVLADPLLQKAGNRDEYIPAEFDKSSNKYLSLRYNTPEWVLKIWEHYGFGTTYKILKKNSHQNTSSVRVRTSLLKVDDLLNTNSDFVKTKVDDILYYGGKIPLRKLDEFRDGKIFTERLATKSVLDGFKISEPLECFCYCTNQDSSLIKELIETYRGDIGLNIGVKSLDNYVDVSKMIKEGGFKNINFFAANSDSMESAISKPQDLVIVCPASSNFDLIREYPDYLLHFKKENMDALFLEEKASLENTAKFVAEKGTLIYMIYTISKKEGHQTITDFLLAHNEFHFVKEEQLFPFDEFDTSLYYAVLKKETIVAKAETPLPAVQPAPVEETPTAQAKSSTQE